MALRNMMADLSVPHNLTWTREPCGWLVENQHGDTVRLSSEEVDAARTSEKAFAAMCRARLSGLVQLLEDETQC